MSEQNPRMDALESVSEEATKIIPSVNQAETTLRRRRADRHKDTQEPEKAVSEDTGTRQNTDSNRIVIQNEGRVSPVVHVQTPRPQALERTSHEGGLESRTAEPIRKPVSAPGYTRRPPLGYDPEAEAIHSGRMEAKQPQASPEDKPGSSTVLMVLAIIVLVVGLVVLGLHLIPEDSETTLGAFKRTVMQTLSGVIPEDLQQPQATEEPPEETEEEEDNPITVSMTTGSAPMEVTLTFSTSDDIEEVRLVDTQGNALESSAISEDFEGIKEWTVGLVFDEAYNETVQVETLYDAEWNLLGEPISFQISDATPIREETTTVSAVPATNLVLDFSASPRTGTAPVNVAFSMTTSLSATDIRLANEDGEILDAIGSVLVENTANRIWALNMTFEDAYVGQVIAQVKTDDTWMDSDKSVSLNIAANPITTELPQATIEPETTETPEATEPLEPANEPASALETQALLTPFATPEPISTQQVLPLELTPTPDIDWPDDASDDVDTGADGPSMSDSTVLSGSPLNPTMGNLAVVPDEPMATEEPLATEAPTAQPKLTAIADESADPSLIKYATIYNGTKSTATYDRAVADIINMPDADNYARQPYGIMTFRGSSFRQNAAEGTVPSLSSMEVLWQAEAGSVKGASSTYYGIGWTGQPLIIKWSKEIREMSNITEEKKETKALREVIIAGEDGKIYFLDLETGEPTRDVINLGYPMRGTPSVHSLGYPVMAVGQYARKMASKTGDIGMRVYDLLTQKQSFLIDGLDGKLGRPYYTVGSFETSSLYDYHSDSMISAGTNGMLYVTKLNTTVNRTQNTLTMNPEQVSLKTKINKQTDKTVAIESSLAAYQNYVFYADMAGVLRCVDTSTMTTVWAVQTDDSVEAATALDLDEDGNLWLYTANTLQNRSKGNCSIRRYDALTGRKDWQYDLAVTKATKKHNVIAGAKASPIVGRNALDGLVYFTVCAAKDVRGTAAESVLIALNKDSGEVVWQRPFDTYTYSSPVAVYTDDDRGYVIQATSDGKLYLMDGLTGNLVSTLEIEGTINASPAVYKDMLVIGTQGKGTSYIYGIQLK